MNKCHRYHGFGSSCCTKFRLLHAQHHDLAREKFCNVYPSPSNRIGAFVDSVRKQRIFTTYFFNLEDVVLINGRGKNVHLIELYCVQS